MFATVLMMSVAISRSTVSHSAVSLAPWSVVDGPPVSEVARQSGLTPETLAASGANGTLAAAVLTRIAQFPNEQLQLSEAQSAADLLCARVTQLRAQLHLDPTNVQVAAQLRLAKAQLRAGRAHVEAAGNAVTVRAVTALPTAIASRLAASRDGRATRVPPEFWCVSRAQVEWVKLRADLTAERRALRLGRSLPSGPAGRLAQARAHPDVVAATENLSTQLASIRSAFEE